MYSKFGQFIDGKWRPSEKNETYDVINPATEEVIGHVAHARVADLDTALEAAESGFHIWKSRICGIIFYDDLFNRIMHVS